jgi:alkylated DNA repair dioxygenase AlkB
VTATPAVNLLPADGVATLQEGWLAASLADELFEALLESLDWGQEHARFFAKAVALPRLTAWYGSVGYRYSGVEHPAAPFPDVLAPLTERLPDANSVLANLYRHGQDSMGWHSDDEAEFGVDPTIWSVSLGATRRFAFRHRATRERVTVDLPHGSLLVMAGACQRCWHHAVPKTAKDVGPRINLTFRTVVAATAAPNRKASA